jgi:hypothetical protein
MHALASDAGGGQAGEWSRERVASAAEDDEEQCPACRAAREGADQCSRESTDRSVAKTKAAPRSSRMLLAFQARGCRGDASGWFGGVVSPPPPPPSVAVVDDAPAELVFHVVLPSAQHVDAPPIPPPRRFFC